MRSRPKSFFRQLESRKHRGTPYFHDVSSEEYTGMPKAHHRGRFTSMCARVG